jgi:hypothetical protein
MPVHQNLICCLVSQPIISLYHHLVRVTHSMPWDDWTRRHFEMTFTSGILYSFRTPRAVTFTVMDEAGHWYRLDTCMHGETNLLFDMHPRRVQAFLWPDAFGKRRISVPYILYVDEHRAGGVFYLYPQERRRPRDIAALFRAIKL